MKKIFFLLPVLIFLFNSKVICGTKDSIKQLKGMPSQKKFSFAVFGNTRDRSPVTQPEGFKRTIKEINKLNPAFAVDLGDLILGYTDDKKLIQKEWEEFIRVTGEFNVPFFTAAGNHDVWGDESEKVYRELIGEIYFSFDYGNSHFIVLDTETIDYTNRIDGLQLNWLRKDLKKNSGTKHIFVFIHKPIWRYNQAEWDKVHSLLREYNTRAVFAGHEYLYFYENKDDIEYFITGYGGTELSSEEERGIKLGDFPHYMTVTVDGKNIQYSVMKEGNIEPKTIVTGEDCKDFNSFVENIKEIDSPRIIIAGNKLVSKNIAVLLNNSSKLPVKGKISWQVENTGWVITSKEKEFTISSGNDVKLDFTVSVDNAKNIRYPTPYYICTFIYPKTGKTIKLERNIILNQELHVPKTKKQFKIDGNLNDWGNVPTVRLNSRDQVVFEGMEWSGPEDLSADIYLAWDKKNFYIAAKVLDTEFNQPYRKGNIWCGDGIQIDLDTLNDKTWEYDNNDYEFGFSLTADGPESWCWYAGGNDTKNSKRNIPFKALRKNNITCYEFSIPWEEVPPMSPGKSCGFNIIVNDDDGEGRKGWIQLAPGIGEGKYPVYYADLIFES
jgi:hypothetical protein